MATAAADLDLGLLIKMMGMTQSDNDNQALVALRKANGFLAKAGVDWNEILTGKVRVIADPFAGANAPTPPTNGSRSGGPAWTPRTTAPPPPPPKAAARPPSPGVAWQWSYTTNAWIKPTQPSPSHVWHDTYGWQKPVQQQNPNARVTYTKRAGDWILKSDQALVEGLYVSVSRRDGKSSSEYVGTLILNDHTGYYYNTSKTKFKPISSLSI